MCIVYTFIPGHPDERRRMCLYCTNMFCVYLIITLQDYVCCALKLKNFNLITVPLNCIVGKIYAYKYIFVNAPTQLLIQRIVLFFIRMLKIKTNSECRKSNLYILL